MQPRRIAGLEKAADVLEQIWRGTDRNTPSASLCPCRGFVHKLRAMRTSLKTDVLRCLSVLQRDARTRLSHGGTLGSLVPSMPGSGQPGRCGRRTHWTLQPTRRNTNPH